MSGLALAVPEAARMHDAQLSCGPTLAPQIFETKNDRTLPRTTYSSGEPHHGMITMDTNAKLTLPQSRPLTLDSFNSGCINPELCIDAPDAMCPGAIRKPSAEMVKRYDELYAPMAPGNFDLAAPAYVEGIKRDTVNSSSGWATQDGEPRWKKLCGS